MMRRFPIRSLEAEESFSDKMVAVVEGILDFLASGTFRVILTCLGIALLIFLLIRLYMRLRTSHLGNIEYERTFSEKGQVIYSAWVRF